MCDRIVHDHNVWNLLKVALQTRSPGMDHRMNEDVRQALRDRIGQPPRRAAIQVRCDGRAFGAKRRHRYHRKAAVLPLMDEIRVLGNGGEDLRLLCQVFGQL